MHFLETSAHRPINTLAFSYRQHFPISPLSGTMLLDLSTSLWPISQSE